MDAPAELENWEDFADPDSDVGFMLEVDLEYPEHLHLVFTMTIYWLLRD